MANRIAYADVLRAMTDKLNAMMAEYEDAHLDLGSRATAATNAVEGLSATLSGHQGDLAAHGGYQRPPLAHAGTHAANGTDPISVTEAQVGFSAAAGHRHDGVTSRRVRYSDLEGAPTVFPAQPHASTHALGGADALALAEEQVTFNTGAGHRHDGVTSRRVRYSDLEGIPTSFPVGPHAGSHASGGTDALNAATLSGVGNTSGQVPISNGTVCANLNADLLDGKHASAFALTDHTHPGGGTSAHASTHYATGTDPLTVTQLAGVGNGNGQVPVSNGTACANLNADMLDGMHATAFATSGHTHSNYATTSHTHSNYATTSHTHTSFSSKVTFNGGADVNNLLYVAGNVQANVVNCAKVETTQFYLNGTAKTAVFLEADGSWTRFVATEGEVARFEVILPLHDGEEQLPGRALIPTLLARADARFLRHTERPYYASILLTEEGYAAKLIGTVRHDTFYQVPPYGEGMGAPTPGQQWDRTPESGGK